MAVLMFAPAAALAGQSDWDLYLLRLVNRARQDPAGEPGRIGSAITATNSPMAPLAYNSLVAQAAANHGNWMFANLGGIATTAAPDSFTHYETLNGLSGGIWGTSTPGYTGATIGPRLTAAGYNWGYAGENILASWASYSQPVTQAMVDADHKGWWESAGHRANMLNTNFTVFGSQIESRSITGGIGNLPSWATNMHMATQEFARPLNTPYSHVLGLVYNDRDVSGGWTPRNTGDGLREGLGGLNIALRSPAGTATIASGKTCDNGAFGVQVGDGTYDVVISGSQVTGTVLVVGVTVAGANIDAGDFDIRGVPAGNVQWQGTRGGEGAWATAVNWTAAPSASLAAMVDNTSAAIISSGTAAAAALHVGHFNGGLVRQTGGSAAIGGDVNIAYTRRATGRYELLGGSLRATGLNVGGGPASTGGTGSMVIGPGASATIGGAIRNYGSGIVRMEGGSLSGSSFTSAAGRLEYSLTGTSGAGVYGRVHAGTAQLGGTLEVEFSGGLALGGTYVLMDYSSVTGTFAGFEHNLGPYLAGGPSVGTTALTVNITPLMAGDLDLDGQVRIDDLVTLAQHWNISSGADWFDGDCTGDGAVVIDDLVALAQNWNRSLAGAGAAVPEPATLAVLAAGGLALSAGRRRPGAWAAPAQPRRRQER
jgi:hypothetical protein